MTCPDLSRSEVIAMITNLAELKSDGDTANAEAAAVLDVCGISECGAYMAAINDCSFSKLF